MLSVRKPFAHNRNSNDFATQGMSRVCREKATESIATTRYEPNGAEYSQFILDAAEGETAITCYFAQIPRPLFDSKQQFEDFGSRFWKQYLKKRFSGVHARVITRAHLAFKAATERLWEENLNALCIQVC